MRSPRNISACSRPPPRCRAIRREQRKTVGGKATVAIRHVEPVGNYAVRLHFDDTHDTGIYTWGYLLQLGREHEKRWAGYLEELKAKGLSR